jgi:uncharacterized protein YxjI
MKLMIKQRVFSWTDTYDVYDEYENSKYFVKAEFLSLAHKLHIFDRNDREIGVIRQKLLSFMPIFEIEKERLVAGSIQKKFTFFKPRYEVQYKGWNVDGNFLGWDYQVYHENRQIMSIHKEFLHWGDTYVIDFHDVMDEVDGLLLVIAIDAANRSNNN